MHSLASTAAAAAAAGEQNEFWKKIARVRFFGQSSRLLCACVFDRADWMPEQSRRADRVNAMGGGERQDSQVGRLSVAIALVVSLVARRLDQS